jgi:hypothetical protein
MLAPLLLVLAAAPQPVDEFRLGVGSQKVLSIANIERYGVEDEARLGAQVVGTNQLLLLGQAAGRTRLHVFRHGGAELVFEVEVGIWEGCWVSEVRKLLPPKEPVGYRLVGDHILVEGQVTSPEGWEKVHQLSTLYPNVSISVTSAPELIARQLRDVNAEFERRGWKVHASRAGDAVVVEGEVEDSADALKVTRLLEPVQALLVPPGRASPSAPAR